MSGRNTKNSQKTGRPTFLIWSSRFGVNSAFKNQYVWTNPPNCVQMGNAKLQRKVRFRHCIWVEHDCQVWILISSQSLDAAGNPCSALLNFPVILTGVGMRRTRSYLIWIYCIFIIVFKRSLPFRRMEWTGLTMRARVCVCVCVCVRVRVCARPCMCVRAPVCLVKYGCTTAQKWALSPKGFFFFWSRLHNVSRRALQFRCHFNVNTQARICSYIHLKAERICHMNMTCLYILFFIFLFFFRKLILSHRKWASNDIVHFKWFSLIISTSHVVQVMPRWFK